MASTAELVNEWGAYVPDMVDAISSGYLDGHLPELLAAIQAQMIANGTVATRRRPGTAAAQPDVNPGYSAGAGVVPGTPLGFDRITLPLNPPQRPGGGYRAMLNRYFTFPPDADLRRRNRNLAGCLGQVVKINRTRCVVKVVGHEDPYSPDRFKLLGDSVSAPLPYVERLIQAHETEYGVQGV